MSDLTLLVDPIDVYWKLDIAAYTIWRDIKLRWSEIDIGRFPRRLGEYLALGEHTSSISRCVRIFRFDRWLNVYRYL